MKKHRFKNYLKFGLFLFGISLAVISCQQDDIKTEELNTNESPFSMRMISKAEFSNNPKVLEQLEKFTKNVSDPKLLGRDVYNPDYDFTVNTDYSKYIESSDGSLHSYTFLIKPVEDNGVLENLVLTLQTDGSYKAEIVSYEFIDNERAVIKTAPLENFDTSQYLGRFNFSYSCTTTVTYSSSFNDDCSCQFIQVLDVQTNCTYTYYNIPNSIDAGDSGGGGGWNNTVWTNTGGSGTSTGTGNTNGNNGTTTATSPLAQSHIDKLILQTKNSQIKARIQQMEGDLETAIKEQGSEFRRNANVSLGGDLYSEYQIPNSQTVFSGVYFPNAVANSEVRTHMHHNNTQTNAEGEIENLAPVFSIEDVFGMAEFYKQKKEANSGMLVSNGSIENISSLLISRRGLYALRITDPTKATEFNDYLTSNATNDEDKTYEQVIIDGFIEQVIDKTKDECVSCTEAYEDAIFELNFIKFYKKLDSGIGLFVSYETDENGDYIWTFLTN